MGKRKKQPPLELHIHIQPPSPRFSRRVFDGVLITALGGLVLDRLKAFLPFIPNGVVRNDHTIQLQLPTISPSASQTFPPTVIAVAPLRINVSDSIFTAHPSMQWR